MQVFVPARSSPYIKYRKGEGRCHASKEALCFVLALLRSLLLRWWWQFERGRRLAAPFRRLRFQAFNRFEGNVMTA